MEKWRQIAGLSRCSRPQLVQYKEDGVVEATTANRVSPNSCDEFTAPTPRGPSSSASTGETSSSIVASLYVCTTIVRGLPDARRHTSKCAVCRFSYPRDRSRSVKLRAL